MQVERDMARRVARLEGLLARRMGLRRGPLALRVKRARGALPEAVRRDLLALAAARQGAGHPKIARQIDARAMAQAERRVARFLKGPVLRERRVTRRVRWKAARVLNLALIALGAMWFAMWRGLV
ncbi:hypothetical protein SSE37_12931 [Sagittula stellata E-37]|uniref:Uncharacterized protein n=2 Tax=Sagittula stellata TaxID=52603 RepID=A3K6X5_SAGS3|nr:hypothetical protein SSE37_12931 [Sagittula stellata E-37]